jgi:hypothetical protein
MRPTRQNTRRDERRYGTGCTRSSRRRWTTCVAARSSSLTEWRGCSRGARHRRRPTQAPRRLLAKETPPLRMPRQANGRLCSRLRGGRQSLALRCRAASLPTSSRRRRGATRRRTRRREQHDVPPPLPILEQHLHHAPAAAECGHHPYDREVAKLAASQRKRAAQLLHQLQAAHRAQEAASVREGALIQELAVAFTKAFGTTVLSSARSAPLPATAAPQRARSASRRGEAARDEIPSRPASGGPVSRRNAATSAQRRENAAARRPPSPTVNVQSFLYRNCARHAGVQPKVDTWRRRSPTVKAHTDIAHMNRSHSGGPPRPTSGEGVRTLAHQHPATFFQEGARRAVHFVPATAGAAGSLWARN